MSDDDIDDKPIKVVDFPDCKKSMPSKLESDAHFTPVKYVSKSSKFKKDSDSDSDSDNIEIRGQLGDIDKEFERASQELILGSKELDKCTKQNDDSDKSSSSDSGIWEGIPNDQDIDQILGNMKYESHRSNFDEDEGLGGESQLEEISNKISELSTSVDNLEESMEELNKKVDRMSKNIKKILDAMNILAGKSPEVISTKKPTVNANDKHDPVNNLEYFAVEDD